jgi:hypothetical protein
MQPTAADDLCARIRLTVPPPPLPTLHHHLPCRPWHAGVHLPQLRRLVLRRATSDAGLASLPGSLGALVSLTLEGCPYVSDHGLGKAAGLPFLEEVRGGGGEGGGRGSSCGGGGLPFLQGVR